MIVIITGERQVGKTTIADHYVKKHGFIKFDHIDPRKITRLKQANRHANIVIDSELSSAEITQINGFPVEVIEVRLATRPVSESTGKGTIIYNYPPAAMKDSKNVFLERADEALKAMVLAVAFRLAGINQL